MFESEYLVFRLVWLVLVLLALGWLIFSGIGSVSRYLEYPTAINLNETRHEELRLPAVTICSQTFADKYKIYANDNDEIFDIYKLNISACAATAEVRAGLGAPCGHALACTFASLDIVQGQISECTPSYQNIIKKALKNANVTFNMLEFIYTFSESWEEVLQYCFYGVDSKSCTSVKIFKKAVKNNRLCHTLNDDSNTSLSFYSEVSGSIGGITVLLKNRPDRYFYPRFVEGFVAYIHQKETGFDDHEVNVPPGRVTSIAVEQEKIQLLEEKDGGKCRKKTLQSYKTYTQTDCHNECLSNSIKQRCGCTISLTAVQDDFIICSAKQQDCVYNNSGATSYKGCDCPLACEGTNYKTSVSYGAMPRKTIAGVPQMLPFADYSENDFLAISVFYSSHRVLTFTQERTFWTISLLGEIGGNMGLLLGCSVITLVEFLFLFVKLLMSCFRRRRTNTVEGRE